MINFISLFLLSIVSAILYRLGGSSKEDQDKEFPFIPRWFKNLPKKRDVGCNIVSLLGLYLIGIHDPLWIYVISFGLIWASLSSYFDFLFGYDNHWFHGFMIGFSLLPFVIWGNLLFVPLIVRSLILAVGMGLWSKYNGDAFKEEMGRGFLIPLTLVVLM